MMVKVIFDDGGVVVGDGLIVQCENCFDKINNSNSAKVFYMNDANGGKVFVNFSKVKYVYATDEKL